jgi:predicted HicB family RNase H-like nuclease
MGKIKITKQATGTASDRGTFYASRTDAAMDTYLHSCAHRSREPSEHFSPRRGRLTLWQRVGFTSC